MKSYKMGVIYVGVAVVVVLTVAVTVLAVLLGAALNQQPPSVCTTKSCLIAGSIYILQFI